MEAEGVSVSKYKDQNHVEIRRGGLCEHKLGEVLNNTT